MSGREKKNNRLFGWLLLILLLLGIVIMKDWLVRKMTYPAPWVPVHEPPAPLEEIALSLSGGEKIFGWRYSEPSAGDSTPVLLFFHGNGENLQTMARSGIFTDLIQLGVHFLAMDYPGYGKCAGEASEAMLLEAADSAFVWLADQYPEHPKVICGWSLGAAVAFQTAAKYPSLLDGFIALSAWSSLADVAAVHYPRWLVNRLLRETYDSLRAARQIHCPSLVIHGAQDEIIPPSQGERVAAVLPGEVRFLKMPNSGHNDLFNRQGVWEELKTFLNRVSQDHRPPAS